MDLEGLNKHWREIEDKDHVYICLRGQVKGEHGVQCHLLPCINKTNSGINVRGSLSRLMKLKEAQGFTEGPAVSNIKGNILTTNSVNDCLIESLEALLQTREDLFPTYIKTVDDINAGYHIYRTLRQLSDAKALEEGVKPDDIDIVNRWVTVEKAKGKKPNMKMRHHYADVTLLLKPFLRYTRVL